MLPTLRYGFGNNHSTRQVTPRRGNCNRDVLCFGMLFCRRLADAASFSPTCLLRCPSLALVCFWATSLLTSGCTKFDLLNATIPSWGYASTVNIPYGEKPRQSLDVYRPKGAKPGAPVVIFFYGGDWQAGKKGDYRFVAEALTSKGFVAVLPDYRIYPNVTFPAFVEDAAKSVRWVHDHISQFGGDPKHIYLMGHSAGAHIAAMLTLDGHFLKDVGLSRQSIRATAGLSGPYDFTPPPEDAPVFGAVPGRRPPPRVEPIAFVDGHEPPMLLVQGRKDVIVDPFNAVNLARRIRRAGGEVRAIEYPDRGHVGVCLALAWDFRWLAPVLRDVTEFFWNH